jgi:hypothetical protein
MKIRVNLRQFIIINHKFISNPEKSKNWKIYAMQTHKKNCININANKDIKSNNKHKVINLGKQE